MTTSSQEHCALCEEAKEVLRKHSTGVSCFQHNASQVLRILQFVYEECYIDDPANKVWFEKYKHEIPVIHINGRFIMKHRVNERLLRKTLNTLEISDNI